MKNGKVNIGVVGAGFIGDKHITAYGFIEKANVVAIADKRTGKAEELASRCGAKVYPTLEEMLEKEKLDVVDIGLPSTLHRDAVIFALRSGHDVIVEKPFAVSIDDIDAMIAAVRETGRRLMVAHVCRFKPEYVFARKMIDSGELGRPLYFNAWRDSETPTWSWNNWLFDRSLSGGTILDLSIHDIDIANWFLGEPVGFYAQEVTRTEKDGPSHVMSNITYANGTGASIEAGHIMPPQYPFTTGFRLVFEKGVIENEVRAPERKIINVFDESGAKLMTLDDLPPILGGNPYAEELKHYVEALVSGKDFKISLEEARLAVMTVRNLTESLVSGQRKLLESGANA